MNAILVLCNFCEAHGPKPIFCTQTLRDTKLTDLYLKEERLLKRRLEQPPTKRDVQTVSERRQKIEESPGISSQNANCDACKAFAVQEHSGFYSEDEASDTIYLSSRLPIQAEIECLVNEAAIRSLSCDTNPLKNGGFVFFANTVGGYVLSHTFHLNDIQARGFFQLYSIVVIMKDKYYLLNAKPFLAQHLQTIATELKNRALIAGGDRSKERCFRSKCSQHQQVHLLKNHFTDKRITVTNPTPRSLITLTNDAGVFEGLHQRFSWVLMAGAQYLNEYISQRFSTPLTSNTNIHNNAPINRRKPDIKKTILNIETDDSLADDTISTLSIRYIRKVVGNVEFPAVCFCVLTGIKLIISGTDARIPMFLKALKCLLPKKMFCEVLAPNLSTEYEIIESKCRILTTTAQLKMNYSHLMESIYFIKFSDQQKENLCTSISISWNGGTLPAKLPDLLQKLLKAADEVNFNDFVLNKHTNALIEEWKNKMSCWKCVLQQTTVTEQQKKQMKSVLGILAKDIPLLEYWMKFSSDN